MKKYKLDFYPNMDTEFEKMFEVESDSLKDLKLVANNLADYTLFLHDEKMMSDYSNMMCLYENINDLWYEIEDEE